MKKIVSEIEKDYEKLKSLTVKLDEVNNRIILEGVRYKGYANGASESQINYIISFPNVDYHSKSNLRKSNKWFLSACIDIVQKYPSTNFLVEL